LHFRQFNGSKTRIVDKVEMRSLSVLIELAANNRFQSRQGIGSRHNSIEANASAFSVVIIRTLMP